MSPREPEASLSDRRPLLFYAEWPLGYHNLEAERKARAFAAGGYEVVYVAGVGVRNPRVSSLPKLADRATRKLAGVGARSSPRADGDVGTAALLVVPPRQNPSVRRLNVSWLERQLRRAVPTWERAVAWVRFPTPELVDALARLGPAVTVYECVDPHHLGPGITGRWTAIHDRAERALVSRADMVVVPGHALAERFRALGAPVRVVPHGVELSEHRPAPPRQGGGAVIGFVGTLDYRIDTGLVRRVAEAHPEWRVRLIGPIQGGFDPADLSGLSNVSLEPPVAYERLGETLAGFHAGVMPYRDDRRSRYITPVKGLELLAAGRPAVGPPLPALKVHPDVFYFAETPDGFVGQLERALREDSPELARRRRQVAEANRWERRTEELRGILDALSANASP